MNDESKNNKQVLIHGARGRREAWGGTRGRRWKTRGEEVLIGGEGGGRRGKIPGLSMFT